MSAPVDVLAVMDRLIESNRRAGISKVGPFAELIESRAAVAELIEAAKKAQVMMAMPERIEPRHRQELCAAISRCEIVADPRLARAGGAT